MTDERVEHERPRWPRWPAVGDRVKWKNEKGEWRYGAIELEGPQFVPEGHEPMCVVKGDDGDRRWLSVATEVFTADEPTNVTENVTMEGSKIYHSTEEFLGSISERALLLDEAKGLITGDRNHSYGPPDQDFRRAAEIMNIQGYTGPGGRPLVGRDVAILQIAVKLSRLTWSPDKRDHYLDIAGYIACGWECKTLEEE